jgi:hypothetical protein
MSNLLARQAGFNAVREPHDYPSCEAARGRPRQETAQQTSSDSSRRLHGVIVDRS